MSTQINADDSSTTLITSTTADWEADTTPMHTVVSTVADAEDVDSVDLPPLYGAIDPDALDDLFLSDSAAVDTIEFQYAGYTVAVHGEGTVEVYSDHV